MDACLRFQFHACTHPTVPIINGASFGINQGHKSCRAFVSSGKLPLQDIFADVSFTHASSSLPSPPLFFYFLFSLSFHFTLHTRALLPFLFLFLSLPPPPIDRRINPTWRAKQAESTLTWPVVFDGREEISVEFHSRHIGNPLLLPLPSPALGLGRLNWTFEWRGLLRSVFLVAAAPVFSGSLAKERYRGGYRYC